MTAPRVSVFIPAYDRERHVADAIRSTLAQTFTDFECIVVDDGSSDGTAKTVESFDDPRIRLIRNPTNLGIPRTRNLGIDLARGEYVAPLDSDDESLPDRLAEQTRFLDAHPKVSAVGSWARAMREDGRSRRRIHRCPESSAALGFSLRFKCAPRQSTMMIRRSVLAKARYDERCIVSQDLELFGRLARDHEIRALQRPLVRFRHHPGRVTEKPYPEREAIRRRIFADRLRESGLSPTEEDLDLHMRLTGRSERMAGMDADFVAWAGGWLTDLARRQTPGATIHPEVLTVAKDMWMRVLEQAVRARMPGIPFDAAPELLRAGWVRSQWLRLTQIGKR